jgi:hypothetical protein
LARKFWDMGTKLFTCKTHCSCNWDPHFGQPGAEVFTWGDFLGLVNISYSGVYQCWYTIGLQTTGISLYSDVIETLIESSIVNYARQAADQIDSLSSVCRHSDPFPYPIPVTQLSPKPLNQLVLMNAVTLTMTHRPCLATPSPQV